MVYSPAMVSSFRSSLLAHGSFVRTLRSFFTESGYGEVDTPTLSPFLIPEPAIEVFRTEYIPSRGSHVPLWLIPSPEIWMKRLLAQGSGSIFQISHSFRNSDFGGPMHNPEFRLLEWYTVGSGYLDSIAIAEDLFSRLLSEEPPRRPKEQLAPPFLRLTMEEAFHHFAGIELAACQDVRAMKEAGLRQRVAMPAEPTWEEAFHIVFLTLVEPRLPRDRPLALTDYPALVPTTARRKTGTPWSERWELFVDGVEIANCYTEETEPAALRALLRDESERKKGSRVPHRIDHGLAEIFPADFPICSGAALGVDRLEMVFRGEKSLEGVILFPFSAILDTQSDKR
jgi:elongation factor P--(R)-beta-lysine ligase